MIATDEDALICDFAETYHIYDYRSLPLKLASILAAGLRDDSRIKTILSGQGVSTETLLQAAMVDALNLLVWSKTKEAQKGRNRPASIVEKLTTKKPESEIVGFDTVEAFNAAREELIRRANNG